MWHRNLQSPGNNGLYSLIGGFQYAGAYLFTSNAVYNWAGAVSSTTLVGSLSNQMSTSSSAFSDPMDLMIDTMREVAFRASVKAGKENATITNASADRTIYRLYHL